MFWPGEMEFDNPGEQWYTLAENCDHNTLCKEYRNYVNEQGKLRTLEEKAARAPLVNELAGCMFVHTGIKNHVQPDSEMYDKENPEKDERLVPFDRREQQVRELHRMGVGKLYLRLDGWAQPGYDNRHPDYFPACKEARMDGTYLDVFTCNEGDECDHPEHRMTRKECYEFRNKCFEYLLSQGILSSSEEVSDWAVPSLVFCHYAPYEFMLKEPETPKQGIPVPLYNLVYHDCVIQPWMMDRTEALEPRPPVK